MSVFNAVLAHDVGIHMRSSSDLFMMLRNASMHAHPCKLTHKHTNAQKHKHIRITHSHKILLRAEGLLYIIKLACSCNQDGHI